jgi:hypothetical protein
MTERTTLARFVRGARRCGGCMAYQHNWWSDFLVPMEERRGECRNRPYWSNRRRRWFYRLTSPLARACQCFVPRAEGGNDG